MIPTLHRYLGRDLVRTAALAAVALTLIVTTFAVIEPLRKEGLNASQALMLFWYLLPVMLSLTLPIAAVFAATFTYGRFAMDNELTACRASGVSRYSLLKPGIAMGVAVGIATLLLSNLIAPRLARQGQATIIANVRGLFYQKLRAESTFRKGSWVLYADSVDPQRNQLQGVVVVDVDDRDNASFYTAALAAVDFTEAGGSTSAMVSAIHPACGEQDEFAIFETIQFAFGPFPVDERLKEREAFYDWGELQAILRNPRHSVEVQRHLRGIFRRLVARKFYEEVAAAINSDQPYELLHEGLYRYVFLAPAATVGDDSLVLSGAGERPVVVKVYDQDGTLDREYRCGGAELEASTPSAGPWGRAAPQQPPISVILQDLTVPTRKPEQPLGQLHMPPGIAGSMKTVDLETLYRHPERFPRSVQKHLDVLWDYIRLKLHPRIVAEIHGRLAYGIGCILLVPLGAALGLIYRGGHVLSAFALCCIPAMVLIVMMLMGKQMISNPDAGAGAAVFGIVAIWSGVALLAALTAYLYGVVLRR